MIIKFVIRKKEYRFGIKHVRTDTPVIFIKVY